MAGSPKKLGLCKSGKTGGRDTEVAGRGRRAAAGKPPPPVAPPARPAPPSPRLRALRATRGTENACS